MALNVNAAICYVAASIVPTENKLLTLKTWGPFFCVTLNAIVTAWRVNFDDATWIVFMYYCHVQIVYNRVYRVFGKFRDTRFVKVGRENGTGSSYATFKG